MNRINPTRAYYIKLGEEGCFEKQCIEVDHTLRLGYNEIPHDICVSGNWDAILGIYIDKLGSDPGAAKRHVNQIQAFYETTEDDLWVTFYDTKLWWCFAEQKILLQRDGSKLRPVEGKWCSSDINGIPLTMDRLSGSLLSMQGYRGTICSVREFDYMVRKINAEQSQKEKDALDAAIKLRGSLAPIINNLPWKDFELLTDLIFRQAGWQRISEVGGKQKGIDIDLVSPIANERYCIQVKSSANKKVFYEFVENVGRIQEYAKYYFVVHKPAKNLKKALETDTHKIWLAEDVARLIMSYGLVDWVLGKAK